MENKIHKYKMKKKYIYKKHEELLKKKSELIEDKRKLDLIKMEYSQTEEEIRKSSKKIKKKANAILFPLKLHWRDGPEIPMAMDSNIQSVNINDEIYVGGGITKYENDSYLVMAYNIKSCQWRTLPPYSAMWFAMTSINNKLVLVGGMDREFDPSYMLGEWQTDCNQWTHPFPSMAIPCYHPSATSYDNWLVVAGGKGLYNQNMQYVEVLNVDTMEWYTKNPIPIAWSNMKSTTIEDTWYFMGGKDNNNVSIHDVYSVSLKALASKGRFDRSTWKKLCPLDTEHSCPLNLKGFLLAVGGKRKDTRTPVSSIQRYIPETDTWVQAGENLKEEHNFTPKEQPLALHHCTCLMIFDKIYVMGGSDESNELNLTFTAKVL